MTSEDSAPPPSSYGRRRDIERLRVVNFVSTMRLTPHFDSERFVYGAPAIEYNPNSFVAMKLRWNARAVALVFAGRQSVMPGSRSGIESRLAILRLINTLMDGGAMMNVSEFVVQNLVCHGWFADEVGRRRRPCARLPHANLTRFQVL